MMSRKKSAARKILLAALCVALILPRQVFASDTAPVRVGYFEGGDYMYHSAREEYGGYNYEFLQEISKLSGLTYEIIDTGSWEHALELVAGGGIDILPAVYRTEERAEQMLFTDEPICNIYTTLYVRADDTRYSYEDFDAFQGMLVGIIGGSEDGESFKSYCREHSVALTIVEYDETDELLDALEKGRLDGAATTYLGRSGNFHSVAQFAPTPLYIAVSKQRPELLEQINETINEILLRAPGYGYQRELYKKYLSPGADQIPVLSRDESEYAQSAGTLRVAYDSSLPPISYRGADGSFQGVAADIFELIAGGSGLSFQFEGDSMQGCLEAFRAGQADVLCAVDGDYLWNERNGLNATLYYLQTPSARITGGGSEPITTLALIEGYQLSEQVAQNNPDKELLYFRSAEECFEALLNGDAQAAYANTQVANYLLSDPRYDDFHATTLAQYSSNLCIGVSKSADARLLSILDKYVQNLADEQIDDLLLNNSVVSRPISVKAFARQHGWLIAGLTAAVLGAAALFSGLGLYNHRRNRRRILDLLYRDELTGLDNLNRFSLQAEKLLGAKERGRCAVVYCDVDRFKLINDNFGFQEGDRLLRAFGGILQRAVRGQECCGRIAADNFVLLLEYNQWEELAGRLAQSAADLNRWRREDGVILHEIGLSFGVYQVEDEDKHDLHQMLDLANYARHSVKEAAGGISLYDERMRQKVLFEHALRSRLPLALERGEFEVYYQPKVNMATGKLVGSEALVRWNHPEHGLLLPGSFIPLFEKKGLVLQVDLNVFETVCRAVRGWLDQGLPVVTISCNFSQLHFGRPGFAGRLADIADRYRVSHSLLEVEITESAIADIPDGIIPVLGELKGLGFQVAIDDFGSGYSSLGQLQRLRADVLKLDRSLVMDGLEGDREQIVVENLIHMVNELGMSIICEGVETQRQAQELQKLGCFYAQGFYYYRPMPAAAFERLLRPDFGAAENPAP